MDESLQEYLSTLLAVQVMQRQVILALCRRLNGDGVLDLPLLLEHLYLLASAAPHTPATPQSALQVAGRAELQKIVDGLEAILAESDDEDPV
jgi:hypothetical protein